MAKKLYPSLEEFYKNNNIEDGDEDIWYSVSDQKLYRTKKRANKCKNVLDSLLNDIMNGEEQGETRCSPTAPPLEEISWNDLEGIEYQPDYSIFGDQSIPPPYSNEDPLMNNPANTWLDDLQPDYDDDLTPQGQAENLNVLMNGMSLDESNMNSLPINNTQFRRKSEDNFFKKDDFNRRQVHNGQTSGRMDNCNPTDDKPGQDSADYMAWMRWRKQVNRQLVALILLRRGVHVHLQTVDLSRKSLSRTSMKEMFDRATRDGTQEAMTSLNGKPYIMYGIPRVALSKHSVTQ